MPNPVRSDPEILGGMPVFVGTRVPFQTLMDYLEEGRERFGANHTPRRQP